MPAPELYIIAGPNGAGKTTLVQSFLGPELEGVTYINPAAIALSYLQEIGIKTWEEASEEQKKEHFIRAANDAQHMLEQGIEEGKRLAIESVLSTRKYCPLVERVQELGGEVYLFYVALESPEISKRRVAKRSSRGGHDVPIEKLEPRWKASLELLPWFALRSARFIITDNSDESQVGQGTVLVSGFDGELTIHGVPSPAIRPVVADFISSFSALNSEGNWRFDIIDSYIVEPE